MGTWSVVRRTVASRGAARIRRRFKRRQLQGMLATAADVRHHGRGRGCQGSSGGDSQCDPPKAKRPVEEQPQSEEQEQRWRRRTTRCRRRTARPTIGNAVSMGYDLSTRCRRVSCARSVRLGRRSRPPRCGSQAERRARHRARGVREPESSVLGSESNRSKTLMPQAAWPR